MLEPEELGRRGVSLGEALRALRLEKGLTGDRLAARCGISQSKISRIETGKAVPSALDVERILIALGASSDEIEGLVSAARIANTEFQELRAALRKGLHKKQRELAALEKNAREIRFFLPVMITGLLNTPEYARASMSLVIGDHANVIARKMERQEILYDKSKQLVFLMSESAIRWALCPPAEMAVQLDRLVSLSRLPNIRIGIVPLGPHVPGGPLNTFTIYDKKLATAETFSGVLILRDPRDVAHHLSLFEFFDGHALHGDAARETLTAVAEEFRARE